MRIGVAAVIVLASTGIAHAGKPAAIVIPPVELEVGAASPVGPAADAELGPATEFRVGMHWASLYWKPTKIDIGVGFVASYRDSYASMNSERTLTTGPDDHMLSLKGMYVTGAYAIENHRHWRTWLGARLEMLTGSNSGERVTTTGVAVRLATELYSSSVGGVSDRSAIAMFAGAWALGVYVEGLHRGIPGDVTEVDAAAGVTMRIPFILAVAD
jgi:hypothetical protein